MSDELINHLQTGDTTVCRAWRVVRRDGVKFGFTDHDLDLCFDDLVYSAKTGLTARALQQTTGLSVDNTEAIGALSDHAISEQDISAGRFDGAEVTVYLVNWKNVLQRKILFHGSFGEITRENGAFRVELRGLTERLNLTAGRVYQRSCSAQLGDHRCKVDLSVNGRQAIGITQKIHNQTELTVSLEGQYGVGLFENGLLVGISGQCTGITSTVRGDTIESDGTRRIALWSRLATMPGVGDEFRLVAGCDKRFSTCKTKFGNALNFRGFPDIPGEEWLRRPPEQKKKSAKGSPQLFDHTVLGGS